MEKTVIKQLEEKNFKFKHSLGQKFLTDVNLLKKIVEDANILPTDNVLEIGAGCGIVTGLLADSLLHQQLLALLQGSTGYNNIAIIAQAKGYLHILGFLGLLVVDLYITTLAFGINTIQWHHGYILCLANNKISASSHGRQQLALGIINSYINLIINNVIFRS